MYHCIWVRFLKEYCCERRLSQNRCRTDNRAESYQDSVLMCKQQMSRFETIVCLILLVDYSDNKKNYALDSEVIVLTYFIQSKFSQS